MMSLAAGSPRPTDDARGRDLARSGRGGATLAVTAARNDLLIRASPTLESHRRARAPGPAAEPMATPDLPAPLAFQRIGVGRHRPCQPISMCGSTRVVPGGEPAAVAGALPRQCCRRPRRPTTDQLSGPRPTSPCELQTRTRQHRGQVSVRVGARVRPTSLLPTRRPRSWQPAVRATSNRSPAVSHVGIRP